MIYVISKIRSNTGLNPLFILTGFFVVKNVGTLSLNIETIYMVARESLNDKQSSNLNFNN